MKRKVVVIGHGYTSRLGVIRALGRMGNYMVDVAVTTDSQQLDRQRPLPIDAYSRYVDEFFYAPATAKGLTDFLLEKCRAEEGKAVLLPESDFAASVIDEAYEKLSPYFYMPNVDRKQGKVQYWMDKTVQKSRAKEIGLNVANSSIIEVRDGNFTIPKEINYPCFAKPISTLQGGKKGVGKCATPQELEERLKLISKYQPSLDVMVEDYIPVDKEYALVGFSDGNNVIIPGVIYITHIGKGNHFGVAVAGKVLPPDAFHSLIDLFKKLIRSIRFVGMFDIDFLESNNQFYFDEINMRIGGSGSAIIACSDNLPQKYVDFVTTGKYDSKIHYVESALTFVNERMCIDEWYAGAISNGTYRELNRTANISFVKDEKDRNPYKRFQTLYRITAVKRFIKRAIKKLK